MVLRCLTPVTTSGEGYISYYDRWLQNICTNINPHSTFESSFIKSFVEVSHVCQNGHKEQKFHQGQIYIFTRLSQTYFINFHTGSLKSETYFVFELKKCDGTPLAISSR